LQKRSSCSRRAIHRPWKQPARYSLSVANARRPYKRIRRIEFCALPKAISGKIRRVQLRTAEHRESRAKAATEFWEEDV